MIKESKNDSQHSLFFSLGDTINQNHPLYIMSNKINWQLFEETFRSLYCLENGRPALPIRLMVG